MTLQIISGVKKYHNDFILDHVTFDFEDNHIYGIRGINGSGKTVLLKALCGYIPLDEGKVLQDKKLIYGRNNYISDAGIIIEIPRFLSHLTVNENLSLLKSLSGKINDDNINDWMVKYKIEKYGNLKYKQCSLGTKQKLSLIQAFIHNPHTLILDEPMNALDSESIELTKDYIREYRNGKLVIMTSHIEAPMDDICDISLKIEDGRLEYL